MILFFHSVPTSFLISFLLIPIAIFLIARGFYILVRKKSAKAIYFVLGSQIFSLVTIAFFVISNGEIPENLFYFALPFGMIVMSVFLFIKVNSIFLGSLIFIIGIFLNACAFASLIDFSERFFRRQNETLK